MIKAGETVNAKKEMRFFLANATNTDTGVTAHAFVGSEITVCPPAASTFSNFAGTVLELGLGHYAYRPTAGELASGGNQIVIRVNVSGAKPVSVADDVVAFDPQDATSLGVSRLDVALSTINTAVSNALARLPAALVGGRIDASLGSVASGAITAAGFAADAITSTVLAASGANKVRDAILAGVIDGGYTVKGALARANAFVLGKATGLKGALATFFLSDGSTPAMQFAQDTSAGTRTAATTVNGD